MSRYESKHASKHESKHISKRENKRTSKHESMYENEYENIYENEYESAYDAEPEYGYTDTPGTKPKKRFKKGLIIYLCILALLLVAACAALWVVLSNYQKKADAEAAEQARIEAEIKAQKEYEKAVFRAPQLAFEDWYAQADANYWTNLWFSTKAGAFDAEDAVRAEMEKVFAPDGITPYKALEYTAENPVFVLKNNEGVTLSRITLSGSELVWNVSDVQLLVEGELTRTITVAKDVKVFCNGVEVGSEFASEPTTNTPAVLDDIKGQLVQPTTWVEYTVSGLLTEPEFTVETAEGFSVTETEDGNFLLKREGEDNAVYQDKAVAFVKSYQYYVLMGGNGTAGNMWATLAHLYPDTQAYNAVLSSQEPIYWNTAHTNIDTSNTVAGDVVVWAYNCYSVDVNYTATASARGTPVENTGCIRVYFMNLGDTFVITHFEML